MGSVMADHWTVNYQESANDVRTETYVLTRFQVPDGDSWQNYVGTNYEIAAFIDGQVRAVLSGPNYPKDGDKSFWRFPVVGGKSEADAQKTITFKVYNKSRNVEYSLATTATFVGEGDVSQGTPSNPILLRLKEPTTLSLADFTLNVGETQDLMDKLTITPAGADMPSAFTWSTNASYSITNNVLTALEPQKKGVDLTVSLGELSSTAKVTILLPATSLTFQDILGGSDTYEVNDVYVGQDADLTFFLGACYNITPENSTDDVVWTSNNNDVVEITANGPVIKAPGDVTLTGSVNRAGVSDIQLILHVKQHVTGITTPFVGSTPAATVYLECTEGDDLTEYFVDGKAFTIVPGNATNKNVTFSTPTGLNPITITQEGKILATMQGYATVTVTSEDDPSIQTTVYIHVISEFQDVNFTKSNLSYFSDNTDPIDISSDIIDNITFSPGSAWEFYNGSLDIVSSNDAVVEISGVSSDQMGLTLTAEAKSLGTATITVSFQKKDYLKATFDKSQTYVTTVQKSFTVEVAAQLTGFEIEVLTSLVVDQPGTILVTPSPVQATLDPDQIYLYGYHTNEGWNPFTVTSGPTFDAKTGGYEFTIVPLVPGSMQLRADYSVGTYDIQEMLDDVLIGAPLDFKEGWQWKTIYLGNNNGSYDLDAVFGKAANSVVYEIRTENGQILNDDVYGYFGDTDLLSLNKCFKIKTTAPYSFNMYDRFLGVVGNITLHHGWNWIPNPFYFNRYLENALSTTPEQGDVIMSKEDGFAEFDGYYWQGSLQGLKRGQGYLYFSNFGEDKDLTFFDEADLGQDDDFSDLIAGAPSFDLDGVSQPQFAVDASRFANNMAIVAELANVSRPEDFMVVAYVDDECRGTGSCYNGKMFITVHADKGETISFRLFNRTTGELSDMDQTVRMTARLGSLKEPFRLGSKTISTGINDLQTRQSDAQPAQRYDLGGRVVTGAAKGVSIQRGNDGKVRKVIVK